MTRLSRRRWQRFVRRQRSPLVRRWLRLNQVDRELAPRRVTLDLTFDLCPTPNELAGIGTGWPVTPLYPQAEAQ